MAQYKRDTLEEKTVRELRQLVVQLGIPGFTKKPKSVIISAIMKKHGITTEDSEAAVIASDGPVESDELERIEATFQSSVTKPELAAGERLSTTIQVSCGASSGSFAVVGRTVAEVADFLREVLNVDHLSTGLVSGKEADDTYILKSGDILEFLKPAGTKG